MGRGCVMGLLDPNPDSGFNEAMLAAAQALLTPRHRGGGLGAAFGAFPRQMGLAQEQARRNKMMGLQERTLDAQMSEAERKRTAAEQAAANRAAFLQAMQTRGGFKPDMLPQAMQALSPEEIKLAAEGSRLGLPDLMNVNGVLVDKKTGQPVNAIKDPNKPFNNEVSGGVMSTVANQDFQDYDLRKAATGRPSTTVSNYIMPATPGQEAVDKKFATDFVEFATGGYADVMKQLDQLREASKSLKSGASISGPVIGSMPDSVLAFTNEKAVSTKEAIQEVAQRNLRLVLGAQFTEKEGDRLIARVYNPRLSEQENAKRLDRLIKQIGDAAQAKLDAAEYFRANGTLTGWQGKLPRLSDFEPDFRKPEPEPAKGAPSVDDLINKYGN